MANLPLKNLKVLDLSRILAGPLCSQTLADLGAYVIKIEKPPKGDDTRQWGPPFIGETSAYFYSVNRNKHSLFLDLKKNKDLTVIQKLASEADVIIENFIPDKLKKYQLDWESLSKINKGLIYCSITGFGSHGPYKNKPGYDALIQAIAGGMSITGPNKDQPTKVGVAVTDTMTGLQSVIGILAALIEREKSGLGQRVEVCLYDTQIASLSYIAMNYLTTGDIPIPLGNDHPSIVPYGCFTCKDSQIMIAVGNDDQYIKFCHVLGDGQWTSDRFLKNKLRVENRVELCELINNRLKENNSHDWLKKLDEAGIPSGPVNNLKQVYNDPHQKHRNLMTTLSDLKTPTIRSPINLSRTPIQQYNPIDKINITEWPKDL